MNEKELKKAIETAWSAVKDIDDEKRRNQTYDIILNNLLGTKKTKHGEEKKQQIHDSHISSENVVEELAKKLQIEKDVLEEFIEIDGEEISLLFPITRETATEEQMLFVLTYLVVKKTCFSEREVESSLLREAMETKGIRSLTNLSKNLKKYPSLVVHKTGKKGSTSTSYKLTLEGYRSGMEVLRDIVAGVSCDKIEANFLANQIQKKNSSANKKSTKRTRQTKTRRSGTGERLKPTPFVDIDNDKLESNIQKFSEHANLDESTLRTSIDFQSDYPRLAKFKQDKVRKITQIKALMLLGIILKKIYHADSFDGSILLKGSYLPSERLDLLDTNKKYREYFSKKPKSGMELTYSGQNRATEMLKEYIETGECSL